MLNNTLCFINTTLSSIFVLQLYRIADEIAKSTVRYLDIPPL
nr:MAG TPA: hypothetical protein [Caudoviricetes sp.]